MDPSQKNVFPVVPIRPKGPYGILFVFETHQKLQSLPKQKEDRHPDQLTGQSHSPLC